MKIKVEEYYLLDQILNMFDITAVKSALVSTVLMAVLAIAVYILNLGDVFKIEVNSLVNVGVMALLTGVVSLIKSLLTNDEGKVVGIQVK